MKSGLVISYFGNSVAVEAADGQVFQCHLRRNQELPVVGDHVEWQLEKDNTGLIQTITPRKTVLARGDNRGNMKVIAANVDMIMIVMAPPPVFAAHLVDRYLVAAESLGITPILVVNKIDLLNQAERQQLDASLKMYRDVPYPVLFTSALTEEGLDALIATLQNKVSVLVGPSGVGKSSIIADLVKQDIRVNEVSPKGAGKHTTTATRLYHLPNGGKLIDSPGVRDFSLWPVSQLEILKGFREFNAFLTGCKFRDCAHTVEPGCAVQAAVADGKISRERFTSYQSLVKEIKK
jgi:ribosome biogenesis GTPase